MEFNSTAFHHVYPACTWRDSNCVSACSQHVVVVDDSDACETCSRRWSRDVQSHAWTHFPRGRSRTGSGVAGSARHPVSLSVPYDKKQRSECVSRSNGPKTNYPPSRKYWKVRASSGSYSFPARRFVCVGLSNDFWLTWPTNEIRRECIVVIKRIESVRMEQPDRSEKEMTLSRWVAMQDYMREERSTTLFIFCKHTFLRRII